MLIGALPLAPAAEGEEEEGSRFGEEGDRKADEDGNEEDDPEGVEFCVVAGAEFGVRIAPPAELSGGVVDTTGCRSGGDTTAGATAEVDACAEDELGGETRNEFGEGKFGGVTRAEMEA